MLTYQSSYKPAEETWVGEVLDFPGTIAYGDSLDQVSRTLALALRDMAETSLRQGEPLPMPDPTRSDPDADIESHGGVFVREGQNHTIYEKPDIRRRVPIPDTATRTFLLGPFVDN